MSSDGRRESAWADVTVANSADSEAQRLDFVLDQTVDNVATKKKDEATTTTTTAPAEEEKSTSPVCQLLPMICGITSYWTG